MLKLSSEGVNQLVHQSKDNFLSTVSHELRTPLFGLLGTISVMQAAQDSLESSPVNRKSEFDIPLTEPYLRVSGEYSARSNDLELPANDNDNNTVDPPKDIKELSNDLDLRLKDLGLRLNNSQRIRKATISSELRQMEVCARNLLSVVNNMINYYKLEHLPHTLIAVPFQPQALLDEVCGDYVSCAGEGVEFSFSVRDGVPNFLVADATLLRYVLANLVSNALRFTSRGKVEVNLDVQTFHGGNYELAGMISHNMHDGN